MAKNIKFKYLYTDTGNYKNYGFVIFSDPKNISITEITSKLETAFQHEVLFIAQQVDLPELFFEDFPSDDDISFHELDGIEITDEPLNDLSKRTINQFMERINSEAFKGWKVFDPIERFSYSI